jgi:hypothetical protein
MDDASSNRRKDALMPTLTYANIGKLPIKPTLQDFFSNGEAGAASAFPDLSSLYQDAAGTVPVTAIGQQVYRVNDLSGRNNHLLQATALARPRLGRTPAGGVRNLLQQTEAFDNTFWTKTNVSVAPSATAAPDGVSAVYEITPSAVLGYAHGVSVIVALTSVAYTVSCYAKANEYNVLVFVLNNSSSTSISFDLSTGVLGANPQGYGFSIENSGNGWFRCSFTFTPGAGNNTIRIIARNDSVVANWTPDGTSGICICGAQLELGSTVTPYQRVTTQWDVTEAGKRDCYCLYGDGIDDTMATAGAVLPVRNGLSLIGAFNAVTPGASSSFATTFGLVSGAVGFTLLTRRQADFRQVGAYVRGAGGATITPITNLGNAGFDYGRPFITSATQNADNLQVLSINPEGNASAPSALGLTTTAFLPLGAFIVAGNSPIFWYGGLAIDRPLTSLEREIAMEYYAYISGAIE